MDDFNQLLGHLYEELEEPQRLDFGQKLSQDSSLQKQLDQYEEVLSVLRSADLSETPSRPLYLEALHQAERQQYTSSPKSGFLDIFRKRMILGFSAGGFAFAGALASWLLVFRLDVQQTPDSMPMSSPAVPPVVSEVATTSREEADEEVVLIPKADKIAETFVDPNSVNTKSMVLDESYIGEVSSSEVKSPSRRRMRAQNKKKNKEVLSLSKSKRSTDDLKAPGVALQRAKPSAPVLPAASDTVGQVEPRKTEEKEPKTKLSITSIKRELLVQAPLNWPPHRIDTVRDFLIGAEETMLGKGIAQVLLLRGILELKVGNFAEAKRYLPKALKLVGKKRLPLLEILCVPLKIVSYILTKTCLR